MNHRVDTSYTLHRVELSEPVIISLPCRHELHSTSIKIWTQGPNREQFTR